MEVALKPEREVKAFTIYQESFEEMERKPREKIQDFVNIFDKAVNLAYKYNKQISQTV